MNTENPNADPRARRETLSEIRARIDMEALDVIAKQAVHRLGPRLEAKGIGRRAWQAWRTRRRIPQEHRETMEQVLEEMHREVSEVLARWRAVEAEPWEDIVSGEGKP